MSPNTYVHFGRYDESRHLPRAAILKLSPHGNLLLDFCRRQCLVSQRLALVHWELGRVIAAAAWNRRGAAWFSYSPKCFSWHGGERDKRRLWQIRTPFNGWMGPSLTMSFVHKDIALSWVDSHSHINCCRTELILRNIKIRFAFSTIF